MQFGISGLRFNALQSSRCFYFWSNTTHTHLHCLFAILYWSSICKFDTFLCLTFFLIAKKLFTELYYTVSINYMNWVMFEYILHAIQIDSHVSSLYEKLNCKTCLVSGVCHDLCTFIYIGTSKCPYVVILIKPLAKCPLYLTRSEIYNYQHVFIVNLRVYFSVAFSRKTNYLPLVVI